MDMPQIHLMAGTVIDLFRAESVPPQRPAVTVALHEEGRGPFDYGRPRCIIDRSLEKKHEPVSLGFSLPRKPRCISLVKFCRFPFAMDGTAEEEDVQLCALGSKPGALGNVSLCPTDYDNYGQVKILFCCSPPSIWNRLPPSACASFLSSNLSTSLSLVSFLGANRTKSASVGPRLLRGAI